MKPKDQVKKSRKLISAGVFIAIYFVIFAIIGSVCMPVPILFLFMPAIIAVVAGPVYMLLIEKTQMPGPIFIAALLPGLFLLAMGNLWPVILTSIIAGVVAEIIARAGKYNSKGLNTLSYVIFTQNIIGGFLPIWIMRDYFLENIMTRGMSQDFADTLVSLTPTWVLPAMIALIAVAAIVGSIIGRKLFKKHFEKAGVV